MKNDCNTAVRPPVKKRLLYLNTEDEWNTRIMQIMLRIMNTYPELAKYTEEMAVICPAESTPETMVIQLKNYYRSLDSMLKNHRAVA